MTISQAELGRRMGLSKGQISKLAARGMPTTNVEAAEAWRRENLMPQWRKFTENRTNPNPAPRQLTQAELDAMIKLWTQDVLTAGALHPLAVAASFLDAGIPVTPKQATRFAEVQLLTIMEYVSELFNDPNLRFSIPAWAQGDEIQRKAIEIEIEGTFPEMLRTL